MKRLHVVPGLDSIGNGMSVAAHLIADAACDDLIEARQFASGNGDINSYDEIWVHSCWLPSVIKSCRRVVNAGKQLVCMPHGNLDPVRLRYHAWKKRLVGPIERWCLRRCDRIVATCEAEKGWIQTYLGKRCPPVEVTDIRRFFNLNHEIHKIHENIGKQVRPNFQCLKLLYLGRRHPLKGVEYLEKAVAELNSNPVNPVNPVLNSSLHASTRSTRLKIVSSAFGEELEKVWEWCDVLVLPTLSDNFGLVIAEALERGKRVITTDGAPAWNHEIHETHEKGVWGGYGGRLIYLKGYRDGTPEQCVKLLISAISQFANIAQKV